MTDAQRTHKIPRLGAAAAITVAGCFVMIGSQQAAALDFVVDTNSAVLDADLPLAGQDGLTSLADAVYLANGNPDPDTITFDPALGPAPYTIDAVNVPDITEDLTITGPGGDQLTITNTDGNGFDIDNDADVTISDLTISAPTDLGLTRAGGIVVIDGGTTTVRNVDIDVVAAGVWAKDLGVGIDNVIIENVTVDDAANKGIVVGDVEMLSVDGLTVTNSALGAAVSGTTMASIAGLDVTDGAYGLYATNVGDLQLVDPTVTGATSAAVSIDSTAATTISGATITDGVDGIGVSSAGDLVDSIEVTGSTLSGQTGVSIGVDDIDDVVLTSTTISGAAAAIVVHDSVMLTMTTVEASDTTGDALDIDNSTEVTLDAVTVNTAGGDGVSATNVTTLSVTGVDVDAPGGVGVSATTVTTMSMAGGAVDGAGGDGVSATDVTSLSMADVAVGTPGGDGVSATGVGTLSMTGGAVDGAVGDGVSATNVTTLSMTDVGLDAAGGTGVSATDATMMTMADVAVGTPGGDGVSATGVGTLSMTGFTVDGAGGRGVSATDVGTLSMTGIAADTTGGAGLFATNVTTLSMTDVTVNEAEESAIGLINVDAADLTNITATRTLGGTGANAGAVFTNGVADLDLATVKVSGATSAGVLVAGSTDFSATGLELTGNDNGIMLRSVAGSITASTINDNTGTGVTVEMDDGTVGLTESVISDNGVGGIAVLDAGPLELDGATIQNNGLTGPDPQGGVYFGPDVTPSISQITNTTIRGNEGDFGGGVSVFESDAEVGLESVTIEANTGLFGDAVAVRGDADGGGGIVMAGGSISGHTGIASEVFSSSLGDIRLLGTPINANSGSSIIEVGGGTVLLQGMEIADNEASAALIDIDGGAVEVFGVTVADNAAGRLVQVGNGGVLRSQTATFADNTAVDSLLGAATAGEFDLAYTTISDNSVTDAAGTVLTHDGSMVFTSDSSVLAGNSTVGWIDAPDAAPDPQADYSAIPLLAETEVSGANNVVVDDPELGPLTDNGGPLRTLLPAKTSPLVDAANPTPPTVMTSDQREFERVVAGAPDIGAVERQLSPFVISLSPARVLETRSGPTFKTIDGEFEGIGRRTNGQETTLQIGGRAGVPDDAEAVVINVTGVDPDGVGFVTVHPCLLNPPLASSLNFRFDVDSGNELVAELNSDGELCLFNRGPTDLVVDVVGYVPNNSRYSAVGPARLLDTRDTGATIDGLFEKGGIRLSDTELELDVVGRGGVTADATAVVINVTAVKPRGIGYVTVHPCLSEEPTAASLNFEPGVNRGNEIVAQLDDEGKICLYTFGSAELVVDVVGQLSSENTYEPVAPARLYETRAAPNDSIDGRQEHTGVVLSRGVVTVEAAGRAGIPADAKGVVVNTTAIRASNRGFLTVWDCVGTMPLAASLNYTTGETVGNELVVDLNADGEFCVFSNRVTDLTVDVVGYLT